jgi:DNA-binding HxlR family transcriptional regulator
VSTLTDLSHHRWAIPVLAEIERTSGSRFATLARRLDVSGESLRRTLRALRADGLVEQNLGYGHPLRPEYVLTRRGRTIAPRCAAVVEAARGREAVVLKKWSLPVLALLDRPRRFSELRAGLPEATPRALAIALKELQAEGLVERRVTDEYPPSALYEATRAGAELARRAAALT